MLVTGISPFLIDELFLDDFKSPSVCRVKRTEAERYLEAQPAREKLRQEVFKHLQVGGTVQGDCRSIYWILFSCSHTGSRMCMEIYMICIQSESHCPVFAGEGDRHRASRGTAIHCQREAA